MDEAHHIIENAPDYLGVHLRVAQIMMDLSQVEQAIQKLQHDCAHLFDARLKSKKAADILNEVIKVAPADINLRTNLIELLEQQERWDEMLDQYCRFSRCLTNPWPISAAREPPMSRPFNSPVESKRRMKTVVAIMHRLAAVDIWSGSSFVGAMRTYQQIPRSHA